MALWLLKTEPDSYSWDDLVREKQTVWDGVTNAAALIHIRLMSRGDLALVYHTGNERAAVGVARIVSSPYPDPKQDDERAAVVDVKAVRQLPKPVTLGQIKTDPTFQGWDLLRIGRLSVVPVPPNMWRRLEQLAQSKGTKASPGKRRPSRTGGRA